MSTATVQTGWLKDGQFDLSFILGITGLAFALAGTALFRPDLFMPLMFADLWLLGYHHVIATYTKLVGSQSDRKQNAFLVYVLLPLVLFSTFAVGVGAGVFVIVTVYFFWQWFHYARQSWGIAQRYRRKAGGLPWDNERLSEVTLWSVPVWGILSRCHQQSGQFLFMDIWMPQIPLVLVNAAGFASAALVAWWVVTRIQAFRRGELALGHTLFVASHLLVFAVGYGFIENINVGWLLVNVWHNAQYVTFVWLYNRQRFAEGIKGDALIVSTLSQPGYLRAAGYYVFCILISTVVYKVMSGVANAAFSNETGVLTVSQFMILFAMTLNFHHYVVDGIIWKRKRETKAASS